MKEKEEAKENKCNNSGTEQRSTVDTMSVLILSLYYRIYMI